MTAMSLPLESYALIGDTHTAALVSDSGSIDWLCLPRFDARACFAALLGERDHGHWTIAPAGAIVRRSRRYRGDTLVLETRFETEEGAVLLVDCMPLAGDERHDVVRVVEGIEGRVPMRMELRIRFGYGRAVPWVQHEARAATALAGPDAVHLTSDVELHGDNRATTAEFSIGEGQSAGFVLTWHPSHDPPPEPVRPRPAIAATESWWSEWASRSDYEGEWRDAVMRSLTTLKGLTYAPTGGVIAAATASLPEKLGGVRNWDYRFCWIRDSTLALGALLAAGYREEAREWRDWLLRAVAGEPRDMQMLYGAAGERELPELHLDWLPGYEGSRPVRVGNAATTQFQLDVYGEVMDMLHQARRVGLEPQRPAWELQRGLLDFLESEWRQPDEGIWEVRSARRHFTHSKVMAWVAFDRAVKGVEMFGLDGPIERWRRLRAEVHDEVCREGYDADRGTFTQHYGGAALDGALLMLPLVGFLPAGDERIRGTVAAVRSELCDDGFVLRYRTDERSVDGLPGGEGAFIPCTFWLVDNLALIGRRGEARELLERLLAVRNDVGLLAEEYDPAAGRLLGNFPQAFSHMSLVQSAVSLAAGPREPVRDRRGSSATNADF